MLLDSEETVDDDSAEVAEPVAVDEAVSETWDAIEDAKEVADALAVDEAASET